MGFEDLAHGVGVVNVPGVQILDRLALWVARGERLD